MSESGEHWSIGEVLSLLQDEFPEITISKIRFLESQGLISPERTPSGYRRFYDSDFDRLRWILVQQRDHYLPLKVIRDRIDAGDTEQGLPDFSGQTADSPVDDRVGPEPRPVLDPEPPLGDFAEVTPHPPVEVEFASPPSPIASQSTGPRSIVGWGREPEVDTWSDDHETSPDGGAADESPGSGPALGAEPDPDPDHAAESELEPEPHLEPEPQPEPVLQPEVEPEPLPEPEPQPEPMVVPGPKLEAEPAPAVAGDETHGFHAAAGVPPLALTKDELAESAGCSVTTIVDLERYGLIKGRKAGPVTLYGNTALTIARISAQFGDFGLGPRHLRTFLIGAEREMGLVHQVVEPLLHRRDEETRRQARATLSDLTDLAGDLRSILMEQALEELLPKR